jgi:hypothetical protein
MAPHQLPLDFSVADKAQGMSRSLCSTVLSMDAARIARDQAELVSLHRGICESVKHVRLDRVAPKLVEPAKRYR